MLWPGRFILVESVCPLHCIYDKKQGAHVTMTNIKVGFMNAFYECELEMASQNQPKMVLKMVEMMVLCNEVIVKMFS